MVVLRFNTVLFLPLLLCGALMQLVIDVTASDYSHWLYGKTFRIAVGDDRKSAKAARTQCHDGGGSLVNIRSDEEVAHLVEAIRTLGGAPALGRSYLVGGVYKQDLWDAGKMTWFYENDNIMTYENWASGQPVLYVNRACVTMKPSDDNGKWRNVDCGGGTDGYYYICAREEPGDFKYGFYGNTYYVHFTPTSVGINGAALIRQHCIARGGVLADIHSSEELQHVKRVIYSLNTPNDTILASKISYVIGGMNLNGTWVYEDGTNMTYTNWIPGEEGKLGCAVVDPDYPLKTLKITSANAMNYRSEPCHSVWNHYICSKKVTGTYVHMTGDYVEGSKVRRQCMSYPAGNYRLEFVVRTADNSPLTVNPWGISPLGSRGFQNRLSTITITAPYTGVTYRSVDFSYIPRHKENGLLIACQKYAEPSTISDEHKLTVAYPPSQTVISDTKDIVEGKIHVITVTVAKSFPPSQVAVEFHPKNAPVISKKQYNNTETYMGFIVVSTITFVPERSDNGSLVIARVTNNRFPGKNYDKNATVQISFGPKWDTDSLTSKTQGGVNTDHIVGLLLGLIIFLCSALALIVYIKLRGVTMCPSTGIPPHRVIVNRTQALEAPTQNGATVPEPEGIAPLPYGTYGPFACEYDDSSVLPQIEPPVDAVNDTPGTTVSDMQAAESFESYDTSVQLALNEKYEVVPGRYVESVAPSSTADPDAYDIVVDATLKP